MEGFVWRLVLKQGKPRNGPVHNCIGWNPEMSRHVLHTCIHSLCIAAFDYDSLKDYSSATEYSTGLHAAWCNVTKLCSSWVCVKCIVKKRLGAKPVCKLASYQLFAAWLSPGRREEWHVQGWRVWKRLRGGKGVLVNSEFIRLLAYASPDQGSKRSHFEHGRQC